MECYKMRGMEREGRGRERTRKGLKWQGMNDEDYLVFRSSTWAIRRLEAFRSASVRNIY